MNGQMNAQNLPLFTEYELDLAKAKSEIERLKALVLAMAETVKMILSESQGAEIKQKYDTILEAKLKQFMGVDPISNIGLGIVVLTKYSGDGKMTKRELLSKVKENAITDSS